ncbi:hypothetical protein OBG91_03415 [Lactococcus lactis]|nr:hypothetical protein [Lactococcus lactis]
MTDKIDIVVSWLDDSDPEWQADFNRARKSENLLMKKIQRIMHQGFGITIHFAIGFVQLKRMHPG